MRFAVAMALACVGCGRFGFDPSSSSIDGPVDAVDPLDHVVTPTGWTKRVYRDFSSSFTYVAIDFVDGSEIYDNLPDWLYFQEAPYPEVLGLSAGRTLIELPPDDYIEHDFGQHPPNQSGMPDSIRTVKFVANVPGLGPRIMISSSSEFSAAGDGTFFISPAWSVSLDLAHNNTRCFVWDATGVYEGAGTDAYLGVKGGVYRRSDDMLLFTGDTKSIRLLGPDLLLTRFISAAETRLVRVTGPPFIGVIIASATLLRLGEGDPGPGLAWLVVDSRRLLTVDGSALRDVIAETTDLGYVWQAAASPPPGHPMDGPSKTVYVIENNLALGIHRVLVFTAP